MQKQRVVNHLLETAWENSALVERETADALWRYLRPWKRSCRTREPVAAYSGTAHSASLANVMPRCQPIAHEHSQGGPTYGPSPTRLALQQPPCLLGVAPQASSAAIFPSPTGSLMHTSAAARGLEHTTGGSSSSSSTGNQGGSASAALPALAHLAGSWQAAADAGLLAQPYNSTCISLAESTCQLLDLEPHSWQPSIEFSQSMTQIICCMATMAQPAPDMQRSVNAQCSTALACATPESLATLLHAARGLGWLVPGPILSAAVARGHALLPRMQSSIVMQLLQTLLPAKSMIEAPGCQFVDSLQLRLLQLLTPRADTPKQTVHAERGVKAGDRGQHGHRQPLFSGVDTAWLQQQPMPAHGNLDQSDSVVGSMPGHGHGHGTVVMQSANKVARPLPTAARQSAPSSTPCLHQSLSRRTPQLSCQSSHGFQPQRIGALVRTLQLLSQPGADPNSPLFRAAAPVLEQHIMSLSARDAVMLAQTYAAVPRLHHIPRVFAALAEAVEATLPSFSLQQLTDIAEAYAQMQSPAPSLLRSIAARVGMRLPDVPTAVLLQAAGSLGAFKLSEPRFAEAACWHALSHMASPQLALTSPSMVLSADTYAGSQQSAISNSNDSLNPTRALQDTRTTLLISNIPAEYAPVDVLHLVKDACGHALDVFHMPYSRTAGHGNGRAFVNLASREAVAAVARALGGRILAWQTSKPQAGVQELGLRVQYSWWQGGDELLRAAGKPERSINCLQRHAPGSPPHGAPQGNTQHPAQDRHGIALRSRMAASGGVRRGSTNDSSCKVLRDQSLHATEINQPLLFYTSGSLRGSLQHVDPDRLTLRPRMHSLRQQHQHAAASVPAASASTHASSSAPPSAVVAPGQEKEGSRDQQGIMRQTSFQPQDLIQLAHCVQQMGQPHAALQARIYQLLLQPMPQPTLHSPETSLQTSASAAQQAVSFAPGWGPQLAVACLDLRHALLALQTFGRTPAAVHHPATGLRQSGLLQLACPVASWQEAYHDGEDHHQGHHHHAACDKDRIAAVQALAAHAAGLLRHSLNLSPPAAAAGNASNTKTKHGAESASGSATKQAAGVAGMSQSQEAQGHGRGPQASGHQVSRVSSPSDGPPPIANIQLLDQVAGQLAAALPHLLPSSAPAVHLHADSPGKGRQPATGPVAASQLEDLYGMTSSFLKRYACDLKPKHIGKLLWPLVSAQHRSRIDALLACQGPIQAALERDPSAVSGEALSNIAWSYGTALDSGCSSKAKKQLRQVSVPLAKHTFAVLRAQEAQGRVPQQTDVVSSRVGIDEAVAMRAPPLGHAAVGSAPRYQHHHASVRVARNAAATNARPLDDKGHKYHFQQANMPVRPYPERVLPSPHAVRLLWSLVVLGCTDLEPYQALLRHMSQLYSWQPQDLILLRHSLQLLHARMQGRRKTRCKTAARALKAFAGGDAHGMLGVTMPPFLQQLIQNAVASEAAGAATAERADAHAVDTDLEARSSSHAPQLRVHVHASGRCDSSKVTAPHKGLQPPAGAARVPAPLTSQGSTSELVSAHAQARDPVAAAPSQQATQGSGNGSSSSSSNPYSTHADSWLALGSDAFHTSSRNFTGTATSQPEHDHTSPAATNSCSPLQDLACIVVSAHQGLVILDSSSATAAAADAGQRSPVPARPTDEGQRLKLGEVLLAALRQWLAAGPTQDMHVHQMEQHEVQHGLKRSCQRCSRAEEG